MKEYETANVCSRPTANQSQAARKKSGICSLSLVKYAALVAATLDMDHSYRRHLRAPLPLQQVSEFQILLISLVRQRETLVTFRDCFIAIDCIATCILPYHHEAKRKDEYDRHGKADSRCEEAALFQLSES